MTVSFFQDLKDFLRYIRYPTLGTRLPGRHGNGWWSDFKIHTPPKLLLKWLFFLLLFNVVVLARLAVFASEELGAAHRINIDTPYLVLLAAVWAPIVEELMFRYGLRRPKLALFYIPLLIFVFISKIVWLNISIVLCLLMLFFVLDKRGQTSYTQALSFRWRRWYCAVFPWVFHGSVLLFASMHLMNYSLPTWGYLWLLPLLILPQWFTGLVIAWMRVRDSFACGVLMHALFNGLPVLLIWVAKQFLPVGALSFLF